MKSLFPTLLSGYKSGVRLVQLLQTEALLGWYGVVYNMTLCRGEYRTVFSFVDVARQGPWNSSWLPQNTGSEQKLEAVLLGMSQDANCRAYVVSVSPMMRHMSLWHALGGEDDMAALRYTGCQNVYILEYRIVHKVNSI